jgi:hypothetical protein
MNQCTVHVLLIGQSVKLLLGFANTVILATACSTTMAKGEDTQRKLATAISENCYQPELNTWNRMEQRKLRKQQPNSEED